MSDLQISEINPTGDTWSAYTAHLERVSMLRHCTDNGKPAESTYYFGAILNDDIVGHISIKKQELTVPASYLTNGNAIPLVDEDGTALYEAFVQTFAVEEAYRRQSYGRTLQEIALTKAKNLGCYQMRSWSSADKQANYALKISMGYAIQPALYPMPGGQPISGVYFVKRLS